MNWKSISKRFLVMLLVLSMVTGLVPVSAFAVGSDAGQVVDAAIIFSDLHTSKKDYKESTVKDIFGALEDTRLPFSSVTSAGDAFSVNADNDKQNGKYTGDPTKITGYIQSALEDSSIPVNYVWSDHDRYATGIDNVSGLVYGAGEDGTYGTADDGNYYVYALSMADMSTYNRYHAAFYSDDEVTAHIAAFVDAAEELDQTKPLFVVSHQPLLDRRGDNGHAYEWAVAINKVAEKMDVAYFFGHNHKYDVVGDYYYAKGATMPVATTKVLSGSGSNTDLEAVDVVLNFPHICAGYMAPGSTSNTTRQGTAMAITIYEDSIRYTTYNKDGVYTGSYAVDETVKRDHAGTTETPVEPDEPETPEPVKDANTGITVAAPGVTAVSVEVKEPEYDAAVYAAYASYDITLDGYVDGTEATVSVPAPANFDVNKPVQVLDQDKGKVIATTDIVEGKITFTTDHFSVYDVAQTAEEGGTSGEASYPYYTIELCNRVTGADGREKYVPITAPVAMKGVVTGQTMYIWAVVKKHTAENPEGEDLGDLPDDDLYWTVSDESIATIDTHTSDITFTGEEFGTFQVTVAYQIPDSNTVITDTITVSATEDKFIVPGDGTNDFPTYPNEGSIRFDKTAQAVGNFSKTGTALVELSMTGVPYTTDNRMDVVLMLDRSSSMYKDGVKHRIPSTIAATKAFIKNIVMNEDGSFNNNRILVLDFLGGNLDSSQGGGSRHQFESNQYTQSEDGGYEVIGSQAELDALFERIDDGFKGQTSLYGTEYAKGLETCYNALQNSKADGNQQFCVFMSDGIPNYMMGETTHFKKTSDIVARFTGNSGSNNPNMSRGSNYEYEYYSTQMKNDGVTVFTVGLGLHNKNSAWSGASAAACEQVANMLLNDISGPAGETAAQRDTGSATSKLGTYFFSVADANAAADMEDVFSSIAHKILEAAKDVVVEDKIKDNYTVSFMPPTGINTTELGMTEYYIQAVEYKLDSNKERTGTPTVLEKFTFDFNGALKTHEVDGVVTCEGQECKHIEFGAGRGNVVSINGKYFDYTKAPDVDTEGNPIQNEHGTIVTEEYIRWNAEKLTTTELALQYFVYLDNSAGFKPEDQVDPGTYDTNEYATLTYDNYQGNRVQQKFPIPQLTWNGAQVSYVFYLVNEDGKPVNRAGREVPFAEAVYVTDVHTQAVTWNDLEQTTSLDADLLADDWVPDVYELYDEDASYNIHVYEDEKEANLNNHFAIGGDVTDEESIDKKRTNPNTTYVFNTKADAQKYNAYGTYVKDDVTVYLCKDYAVSVIDGKYSYIGKDTQWTPAAGEAVGAIQDKDGHVYYMDEEGKYYTIVEKNDGKQVRTGFDFANTTVAFAVVWKPELVPDVVVVDYGLDVVVDVTANDSMAAGVVGVRAEAPANVTMNSGNYTSAKAHNVQLYTGADKELNIGTASLETLNSVRFSLNKDNGMEFNEPAKFYYETDVNYYDKDNKLVTTSMYSSVTVIPATTIYYEDSFVDFAVYDSTSFANIGTWETEGKQKNVTQAQDRPGESRISAALDADNNYGYDAAYDSCSTFSLGSARKVTVNENQFAEAIFSFYGTGFDVISLTSNTTGTITVDLYDPSQFWDANGNATYKGYKSTYMVDTYYGYARDTDGNWVVNNNAENSLYQVPVMCVEDLPYGHYTVVITAAYSTAFDHQQAEAGGSYDFYLDAIRIYDPANDGEGNQDIENAYKADGEGWPSYMELRNQLIEAKSFDSIDADAEVEGMVFIDGMPSVNSGSIGKYVSYGPNNEVYLASGQSVAFLVEAPANLDKMQIGIKSADGNTVNYSIKNVAQTDIPNKVAVGGVYNEKSFTVSTATDMYYDLTGWKSDIIVITNTGSEGILSITNIKSTFTSNPADTNGQNGGRKGGVGIYMTPKAAELTLKAMKPAPVNPFADVKKDEFYYNAVLWAVENDITNGVDAAHFGPTLECNRAQVVTFLWRAAGSPEAETQRNPFVDVKETDFFYKAVLWAVENGITNGLTATTFGPDSLCNRAQVVTFLWRAKGEPVAMATGNPFSDVKADAWYGPAVLWAAENGITNGMGSGSFGISTICNRAQVVTFLHRAASLPELSES